MMSPSLPPLALSCALRFCAASFRAVTILNITRACASAARSLFVPRPARSASAIAFCSSCCPLLVMAFSKLARARRLASSADLLLRPFLSNSSMSCTACSNSLVSMPALSARDTASRSEASSPSCTASASASRALRLAFSLVAIAVASSSCACEMPTSLAHMIAFWITSGSLLLQAVTSQACAACLRFSSSTAVPLKARGVPPLKPISDVPASSARAA
mmetsp:Transcript_99339/g.264007  ORF Transcript_99339/g.264007 Transcript_99339/m.264007 type:complete len:218 (+) Transcript_99339:225-878(+)